MSMPETFDGFDWGAGNLGKCRKHGVSIAAIEDLFAGPIAILPDPQHSVREKRLKAIGFTSEGRAVFSGVHRTAPRWPPFDPADQCSLHACEGDQGL
jgi:uncharacterized DUF497 family protein